MVGAEQGQVNEAEDLAVSRRDSWRKISISLIDTGKENRFLTLCIVRIGS
jgi:hypothetical protein